MANYNLSGRASMDVISMFKYGIKHFGLRQAQKYLHDLESFLMGLSLNEALHRDCSSIAMGLKFYNYNAHVIFFNIEDNKDIFIIRILGKRMNFVEHL